MILVCAASNGNNLANAKTIGEQAEQHGIEHQVLDLASLEWPLYSPLSENRGAPPNFSAVHDLFQNASAFVFCSPEYNGSIPPVLSNAIAWLSVSSDDFRVLFNGKPAALSTQSGGHGQKVLMAMRVQLSHLGCIVVGRDLVSFPDKPLREDSIKAVLFQLTSR